MIRESFNDGWSVAPRAGLFGTLGGPRVEPTPVTLPHDAVRDLPRSAASPEGVSTGYYPGGAFTYTKTFDVPEDLRHKVMVVDFEGVYRDAVVYINGDFAAQRPNGYSGFAVRADPYLRYGAPNTITVEARAHLDSRWYTGAGIYRPVHLVLADPVHLALDGVRVTTPDIDEDRAIVSIAATVENETRATTTVRVTSRVTDRNGNVVAEGSAPVTVLPSVAQVARLRLPVPEPELWSPEDPALYQVQTTVSADTAVLDQDVTTFGIRRLQLDPARGLRINGRPVDLRGACIHHDNGPLGAASIARAEERRIALLKEAGFNAVRSAHNPLARATLEACDRLGVLVMDELTDVWTKGKTDFDYALSFPEWWERDVEAMVVKDVNHPSVIMYSIGNEVFEAGSPVGSTWGRRIAEKIRQLDDTRYVTNALNGLVATIDKLPAMQVQQSAAGVDVNAMMASMSDMTSALAVSELVTASTEESASVLDVVGLNYADARYAMDAELFPHRVIVGSETYPSHVDRLWSLVKEHPHVIGDFTWTGWDYLGEAGIGRVSYVEDDDGPAITGPYPYLVSDCGDFDITGHRKPLSYYREIVFGLRSAPYIAVHRPQHHGKKQSDTPWGWTDSVASWTWDVPIGSPITVDVYTDADTVDLLLDGEALGTAKVGEIKPFLARFETAYRPGELVAVTAAAGGERGRAQLRTATGPLSVHVSSDTPSIRATDADLAFVSIALVDSSGTVPTDTDAKISVSVQGPAVLAGLGTGNPRTEEPFDGNACTTYNGRALGILRPTGTGTVTVTVSTGELQPARLSIAVL